jgi:hypothetical protein
MTTRSSKKKWRVNEVASCAGEPLHAVAACPLGRRPEHHSSACLSLRAMGFLDQADGAISTG